MYTVMYIITYDMLNIRYYILNTLYIYIYISYIYTYLRASGEERKVRKGGHGRETSQKKIWLRQHFFVAFGGGSGPRHVQRVHQNMII